MGWAINDIGKKVKYTPEIITVKTGKPIEVEVVAIGQGHLRVRLSDGSEEQIEMRLCDRV